MCWFRSFLSIYVFIKDFVQVPIKLENLLPAENLKLNQFEVIADFQKSGFFVLFFVQVNDLVDEATDELYDRHFWCILYLDSI